MSVLFPVLTGRERHVRKGSVPEHSVFRLKSFVQPAHSVSPSPDLNNSSQTFRPTGREAVKARQAPREDLEWLEAELDQQEMEAMPQGGLGVEAYVVYLEQVKRRVKRWDEQLGDMLARAVAGLRRGLDSYRPRVTVLSPRPEDTYVPVHEAATQTNAAASPERYPGLVAVQEALERLRDVKYSGVATKLSELYRALSHLASADFPDPPHLQDMPLPEAFAHELKHTFRLIHKDISQAVLLKHKKPAVMSIGLQTEGSGPDPLKLFELEQGIRERENELSRLRGDLVDLRVGSQSCQEQLAQLKTLNLNLEEKCVRLDMEVKALHSKEHSLSTALQEARQQQKDSEAKQAQVQQLHMHLLSVLYAASDKVRRAEREALHLEEALAQAEVTHLIEQRRLRAGGEDSGQLDQELKAQRGRIKGEFEARKAEMLKRHQLMEQQLQDQTLKVDALLVSGSALLKPKPRVWADEEEEPQSPVKTVKKPRVVEDSEEEKPRVRMQTLKPEPESDEEELPTHSPKLNEPRSPVRSPVRTSRPLAFPSREAETSVEPRSPTRLPQSSPPPQHKSDLKLQPVVQEASPVSLQGLVSKQQETERSATEALAAMSAENVAEEKALLEQLSPSEQVVYYKAKALLEHQRVWEQAVRMGMCSKATQTGEHSLPLPAALDCEDMEAEGTPWLKHLAPSPQGLSPRSKRRYHQAVLKAFVGHTERCGAVCQHLLRAMQVRRKVRGLLFPLRVINVRYRLAK